MGQFLNEVSKIAKTPEEIKIDQEIKQNEQRQLEKQQEKQVLFEFYDLIINRLKKYIIYAAENGKYSIENNKRIIYGNISFFKKEDRDEFGSIRYGCDIEVEQLCKDEIYFIENNYPMGHGQIFCSNPLHIEHISGYAYNYLPTLKMNKNISIGRLPLLFLQSNSYDVDISSFFDKIRGKKIIQKKQYICDNENAISYFKNYFCSKFDNDIEITLHTNLQIEKPYYCFEIEKRTFKFRFMF